MEDLESRIDYLEAQSKLQAQKITDLYDHLLKQHETISKLLEMNELQQKLNETLLKP